MFLVFDKDDDNRPLTNEELCRLEINVTFLCDMIDIETVLTSLHTIKCITKAHRDCLLNLMIPVVAKPKPNDLETSETYLTKVLLRVLQRRSLGSYKRLMQYRHSLTTLEAISTHECKNSGMQ